MKLAAARQEARRQSQREALAIRMRGSTRAKCARVAAFFVSQEPTISLDTTLFYRNMLF
jgi:hypothetical protein